MKKLIKNYSKIYVYLLLILLVCLRILMWNKYFSENYSLAEKTEKCRITAKITSVPVYKTSGVSFNAKVTDGIKLSQDIHIKIKDAENISLSFGDTVELSGTVNAADSQMNPGNFSYKTYLKSQGICAFMYTDITHLYSVKDGGMKPFYETRRKLTDKFFRYLPYDEASLVNSLVTGSKSEMTDKVKDDFRKSGVYHIVAVSGLHLNIFILFLSYFYTKFKLKRHIKMFLMLAVNLAGAVFIFIFTGFGISIQRAALMSLILCISLFVSREYSPVYSLASAAYITLILKPCAFYDISFQLSFLSTLGIIFSAYIIKKYRLSERKFGIAADSLAVTAGAWTFTLPATVSAFGGVSVIAFISNIIILAAVPVMLCISYVFSVICLTMPDMFCRITACAVAVPAKAILMTSELFASVPGAYIEMSSADLCFTAVQAAAVAGVIMIFKKRCRIAAYCIITAAIAANTSYIYIKYNQSVCSVSFLNVGQGDCTVIKSPENRIIMIDCGSETSEKVSQYNVKPYLRYKNIRKIDAAVVTHCHTDHVSGIVDLIKDNKIKRIILSKCMPAEDEIENIKAILKEAVTKNIPVNFVSKGDTLLIDESSSAEILYPDKKIKTDANNHSLVIKFKCLGKTLLFTGDIQENAQYKLMNENDIKSDILKIPHHGSYSLLSEKLSEACRPEYSIISCGANNVYGHPKAETLDAFSNSEICRTDKTNTVTFKITKKQLIREK